MSFGGGIDLKGGKPLPSYLEGYGATVPENVFYANNNSQTGLLPGDWQAQNAANGWYFADSDYGGLIFTWTGGGQNATYTFQSNIDGDYSFELLIANDSVTSDSGGSFEIEYYVDNVLNQTSSTQTPSVVAGGQQLIIDVPATITGLTGAEVVKAIIKPVTLRLGFKEITPTFVPAGLPLLEYYLKEDGSTYIEQTTLDEKSYGELINLGFVSRKLETGGGGGEDWIGGTESQEVDGQTTFLHKSLNQITSGDFIRYENADGTQIFRVSYNGKFVWFGPDVQTSGTLKEDTKYTVKEILVNGVSVLYANMTDNRLFLGNHANWDSFSLGHRSVLNLTVHHADPVGNTVTGKMTVRGQNAHPSATGANQNGGDLSLTGGAPSGSGSPGKTFLAENGGDTGIGTLTPQAKVDIVSTDSGLLVPRLTEIQRDAVASPTVSELVWNTDAQQYEYWTGSVWSGFAGTFNGSLIYKETEVSYNTQQDDWAAPSNTNTIIFTDAPATGSFTLTGIQNNGVNEQITFINLKSSQVTFSKNDASSLVGNRFVGTGNFQLGPESSVTVRWSTVENFWMFISSF